MKKVRSLLFTLLVAVCVVCVAVAFSACGSKEKSGSYGAGEEGFYYYDGANSERYMLSLQSGKYMITANGETAYSGSYSYNEESAEISFTSGDDKFTATVGENALSLDMTGSGYSFKAYKYFDVTYVDENGETIATKSVLNGQSAEELNIEKDGYWFIGWYEDSANSSEFAFNTSIAGDTFVYGWYIEKNPQATEYVITLDYGDGESEVWNTTNGAVYKSLPEANGSGENILGWWVSATNDSGELTYKYSVRDVFTSDTTLFAVYDGIGASVTKEGITWDSSRAGANVSIEITSESGKTVLTANPSSSSGSYTSSDFTALGTGVYTVAVGSDTLTYVVNGLDRVSKSSMDIVVNGDGRVLSFAPVENAERYEITISDGQRTVTENLGSRTYYNFSSWDMTKEGITFVVTAYADGFVSSVSGAYNYLLVLENVVVDIDGENVVWSRVENALEYEVVIYGENDKVLESFYTTDTSYSLKYYDAGTYTITVQPVTSGYYSEATKYSGYAKSTLASPVITSITNYSVTWGEVTGATSYVVSMNGEEYPVTEGTTLYFEGSDVSINKELDSYEIAVKAVEANGNDSSYSDSVTATNGAFSSAVSYSKNTVSWNYDISATRYEISVNDGAKTYTVDGTNSQEIELTKVGDNEIVVTAYNEGDPIGEAHLSVYAYSVTLDGNGLTTEKNVVYVAQGDTLKLGNVSGEILEHADFLGWYTQADYTEGMSDAYDGKGEKVLDGSTFTGNRNTYLYAYYSYEYINVTLIVGMGSMRDEDGAEVEKLVIPIKYNSSTYELPVPTAYGAEDIFNGWYSGQNGTGTQYTSGSGVAMVTPFRGEDTTLYAFYLAVLYYSRTSYNGETVYAVSAGSSINSVTDGIVTVPESYNGCRLIINSGAFENCTTLKVLNIPDTVLYISLTNDGYRTGTGAFAGCSALEEVNVYATESAREIVYFSEGGVLFHKITDTEDGDVEIYYYPYAKKCDGEDGDKKYVIPSVVYNETEYGTSGIVHNVTTIPAQVFRDRDFTTVVISNTVTYIASQAFYNNSNLTSVEFETGGSAGLAICDTAFASCTAVTSVALPARYSDFNGAAFSDCSALVNLTMEEGGVYKSKNNILLSSDGTTLVYYPIGLGGDIDISNLTSGSIVKVGDKAFYNNRKITSVKIPASVYEIGVSAFEGCRSMSSIEFEGETNSQALTIKKRAFYGCTLVEELTLPVNLVTLEENAFGGCSSLKYVYIDTAGATVTLNFAENAFGTSNYITTLEFGDSVPGIENLVGVFDGGNLQKIIVSENNTNYCTDDVGALYNSDKTKILYYPRAAAGEYTLESSVTTITKGIFTNRVNLTSISIGASVNSIETGAFDGCTYLEKIIVDQNNTNYGSDDYGILYAKTPTGDDAAYELSELILCPQKCNVTEITVSSSVKKVDKYAFANNASITKVAFEATASFELGIYAFYNCESLGEVSLPECMTAVPDYAFYECENLEKINIPTSVTSIGDYSFYHCMKLTGDLTDETNGISLPEGLKTIGKHAFDMYVNSLTFTPLDDTSAGGSFGEGSVIGPVGGDEEEDGDSTSLAVTIPSTVEKIDEYAFQGCWDAASASVEIVFASNSESTVTTPNLEIAKYAFAYTRYASKVEIPARVTSMGDHAFYYFGNKYGTTDSGSGSGSGGGMTVIQTGGLTLEDDDEGEDDGSTPVTFEAGSMLTSLSASVFEYAKNIKEIEIPKSVTSLGDRAFYYCQGLETITFETGTQLSSIGNTVFWYAGLKSITIPKSVTSIGYQTFYSNGTNLSEGLTFESGSQLSSIGWNAFYNTGVTEVNLPASLTSINYQAFQNCTSLTTVTFQGEDETSNLTEIGYSCFKGCTALTSVELPKNLLVTGTSGNTNGIFEGCTALTSIDIPASVTKVEANTFKGCTNLTNINFPQNCSISSIGDGAFSGCTALTSFTFPESSASSLSLGSEIFSGCTLNVVTLSSNIFSIGSAFVGATIETINVGTNTLFSVDTTGQILCDVSGGTIVFVFGTLSGEVVIPDEVTIIGSSAFSGQTKITEVTIGKSVSSIGDYAFYGCTALKKVVFEDESVMKGNAIGESAFEECTALSEINIPSGITVLSDGCFYDCKALTTLDLPASIVEVEAYAMSKSGITSIDLSHVEKIGNYAFDGASSLSSVTLNDKITDIGTYVFQNTALVSVSLPSSMTSISNYMFKGCSSLISVDIPEGVTKIGSDVFDGCTSLTEVKLPSTLTSLGQKVFNGCKNLVTCDLPANLEETGTEAFCGCSSLENVSFPSKYTLIQVSCFNGCSSLKSIDIGDNITYIGDKAFYGCSSLETVIVGRNVTYLGSEAFEECTSLTYAYTGDLVDSISSLAFGYCTSLIEVEFGTAVKTIGTAAFQGCSALKEMTLNVGLEKISSDAFSECTALERVYIPSTAIVSWRAFGWDSCDLYIENTYNYVSTYWEMTEASAWYLEFTGTAYYYSPVEPGFTAGGDAYDGNFWCYDDDNQITVWQFEYSTYTTNDGGYVLCSGDDGISYVCLMDENGTATVYKVTECTQESGNYNVTLKNGESYTIVLTDKEGSLTATVTQEAA